MITKTPTFEVEVTISVSEKGTPNRQLGNYSARVSLPSATFEQFAERIDISLADITSQTIEAAMRDAGERWLEPELVLITAATPTDTAPKKASKKG